MVSSATTIIEVQNKYRPSFALSSLSKENAGTLGMDLRKRKVENEETLDSFYYYVLAT